LALHFLWEKNFPQSNLFQRSSGLLFAEVRFAQAENTKGSIWRIIKKILKEPPHLYG
jgi:hypothetical protein